MQTCWAKLLQHAAYSRWKTPHLVNRPYNPSYPPQRKITYLPCKQGPGPAVVKEVYAGGLVSLTTFRRASLSVRWISCTCCLNPAEPSYRSHSLWLRRAKLARSAPWSGRLSSLSRIQWNYVNHGPRWCLSIPWFLPWAPVHCGLVAVAR